MTTTLTADEPTLVGDVEWDRFAALVERLSRQSTEKFFNAYLDIAWDDPDYAVDPDDPRWELTDHDPLGATEWYRSQPAPIRRRIGLFNVVANAKTGLQFENILKRGLLEFLIGLDNRDPRFRYGMHEVVEEGHHGMMFQEFVNRSPFDPPGLPRHIRRGANRVVLLGRRFPALFFLFVLGGEDPIDWVQREALRSGRELPPILERMIRIHVTEEARHLSFARHELKRTVPKLRRAQRAILSIGAPLILGVMAQLMMRPGKAMIREFGIPRDVVRAAYTDNPDHAHNTRLALRKVRRLCRELGLMNPVATTLWRAFQIWDDDTDAPASAASIAVAA